MAGINHLQILFLVFFLLNSIDCFQWSQVQQSNHVISSYLGSNVTLPCEFLLSAQEAQQMQQFHVVLWSRQTASATLHYWQALASITNINNALDSSPKIIYPDQKKFSMKNNSLTVFNIGFDDDTHYQCEIKSSFYTTPSTVKLNVLYKPYQTQLVASETFVNANEEGFELNCTALANPKAGYSFFLNGKLVQNSTSHRYIIIKAAEENSGEYTCLPWNYIGEGPNATVKVKVKGLKQTDIELSMSDEVIAGITGAAAFAIIIIVVIAILCKRLRDDKNSNPAKSTSSSRKPSDLAEAHIGPGMYGSEASINKEDQSTYGPPLPKLYKLNGSTESPSDMHM